MLTVELLCCTSSSRTKPDQHQCRQKHMQTIPFIVRPPSEGDYCCISLHNLLLVGRQEKAAAEEQASKAGYEGFRIQGQLLSSLESAIDRAAAAHSDREQ